MKAFILLLALTSTVPTWAIQRVANRYSCTAYNLFSGYATITYDENLESRVRMEYGPLEAKISGGRLTYNTSTISSFPRAVFSIEMNGQNFMVYMDLMRPLIDPCEASLGGHVVLPGITYIPGMALTSAVTCRVEFR